MARDHVTHSTLTIKEQLKKKSQPSNKMSTFNCKSSPTQVHYNWSIILEVLFAGRRNVSFLLLLRAYYRSSVTFLALLMHNILKSNKNRYRTNASQIADAIIPILSRIITRLCRKTFNLKEIDIECHPNSIKVNVKVVKGFTQTSSFFIRLLNY